MSRCELRITEAGVRLTIPGGGLDLSITEARKLAKAIRRSADIAARNQRRLKEIGAAAGPRSAGVLKKS